ncbi:hypothetical protein SUDANB121_03672 [Nocardiopsis dassonvillei]|uniref:LPXTG cell wall anchor domain-containing protein n=1 Tax=Nocardiopsis dassonvillei TaxID=2014 RepID=UPI003F57EB42
MKTTSKIAARRIIQGGAAFAALGALSIATALPAAADVEQYGWAYAASEGGAGFVETQDGTASDSFSVDYGWASWSGTTTASVGADGVRSTVEVPSVRIQITVTDVEDDELEKEEEKDEETDEEVEPTEEPTEEPTDTDGDDSEGDDTSGGEGGEAEEPAPTAPAEGGTETPVETPESSPEAEGGADADATVLQLDETNSETVADSDEILVEATITGISVSTFKSWDGSVSYSINEGTVSNVTAPEGVNLTVTPDSYQWEETTDFEGYLWDDAYAILDYDLKVDGELVDYITVAETGVGTLTLNEGENPDPGEEKPRPEQPSKPEGDDKKPAVKPSEALATTGSPIGGLIAAGAAIAAGGGAAAYLARRKKTAAVEAPAEQNDN